MLFLMKSLVLTEPEGSKILFSRMTYFMKRIMMQNTTEIFELSTPYIDQYLLWLWN